MAELREKLKALVEEMERDITGLDVGPRNGRWRTAAGVLNGARLRLAAILAESEEPNLPLGHKFVALTLSQHTWEGEPGSKPDECEALIESNFTTAYLRCGQPRSAHEPKS